MAVAVSGTPVEIDSTASSGSQSVTVPASCTGVLVGVGGYFASASVWSGHPPTLGGVTVPAYATGGDSNSGLHQHATFFLEGSLASGSQTFAWNWGSAPADGAVIVVAFLTGSATASAVRASNGSQNASPPYPSGSVAALSGDGLISFAEAFSNSGFTWTWTNNTKVADYQLGAAGFHNTTATLAFSIAAGTTSVTVTHTGNLDDGGSSTLAIKPAGGSDGGVTAPAGALVLSANAPTIRADDIFAAPAGVLTLSANAPTILTGTIVVAPAGALVLGSDAPVLHASSTQTAPVGALVLAGNAPSISALDRVSPAGVLTLAGLQASITGATQTSTDQDRTATFVVTHL